MLWDFVSNVNLNFNKLINCQFQSLPQYNTGYESLFWTNPREIGNKGNFWAKKRNWFEHVLDVPFTYVSDIKEYNWVRFAMLPNFNGKRKSIYMQCQATIGLHCYNVPLDIKSWKRIKLWSDFDANLCDHNKFFFTMWWVWEKTLIHSWAVMANVMIWNVIQSVLWFENNQWEKVDPPWNIVAGDWIEITSSNNWNIVVWQSMQAGQIDNENKWIIMWQWFWLGVSRKFQEWVDKIIQKYAEISVYKEYWKLLSFVDAEGIKQINDFDCNWNIHTTLIWQTKIMKWYITSVTNYDETWVAYVTSTGYLNLIRPGWNFMQSLWGTIYQTNFIGTQRDVVIHLYDYLVLVGPESMGITYKTWLNERSDYIWRTQTLLNWLWYFNKESVLNFQDQFYIVNQDARFYRIILKPYDNGLWGVSFDVDKDDMSKHRVNTDFRALNRFSWDRVYLSHNWFDVLVFIVDNRNRDTEEYYTKVLIFNEEFKFWHRWMVCWLDIRGYSSWAFFWESIMSNTGNKDNWRPIKQIISANFWDTSMFTWKEMAFIKTSFGYRSSITKDTIFKISQEWGWFQKIFKFNNLADTVGYVKNLNTLYRSWKTDKTMREEIFKTFPLWLWLHSGNGVGLWKEITHNTQSEFEQYCGYESEPILWSHPCCEEEKKYWVCKVHSKEEKNYKSSDEDLYFTMSKYWVSNLKMNIQWQNFHFELVANNDDDIEFLWWFIWWKFMDNTIEDVSNSVIYDTPWK